MTVLVCSLPTDPVPGRLRFEWVRRMCPLARVVHVEELLPQAPEEHPDFWSVWRDVCQRYAGQVDYVFASEAYGYPLAAVLGARYVPVDQSRALVPVSATAVRADPLASWQYLPEVVRPYYLKRVCVFGPESTGKSTLAMNLARHFATVYAHEYARPLLESKGGYPVYEDIDAIARGQIATEEALARQANRVLFCDTDVLATTIWSEVLFGKCPQWILDEADRRCYDLYLLMDVDVPWVQDGQRYLGDRRQWFFNRCRQELERGVRPYCVIQGSWQQRWASAVEAVNRLLAAPGARAR